jgi:hypothetical protein
MSLYASSSTLQGDAWFVFCLPGGKSQVCLAEFISYFSGPRGLFHSMATPPGLSLFATIFRVTLKAGSMLGENRQPQPWCLSHFYPKLGPEVSIQITRSQSPRV